MKENRVSSLPSESRRHRLAGYQSSCHCGNAHLLDWVEKIGWVKKFSPCSPLTAAQSQQSSDQWWQRSACRRGRSCCCRGCLQPSPPSGEDSSSYHLPLSWIWWWCSVVQSSWAEDQVWTCCPPDPNVGVQPDWPTLSFPCPPCQGSPSFGDRSCAWMATRSKCTKHCQRDKQWSSCCQTWLGFWKIPWKRILIFALVSQIQERRSLPLSGSREKPLNEQTWRHRKNFETLRADWSTNLHMYVASPFLMVNCCSKAEPSKRCLKTSLPKENFPGPFWIRRPSNQSGIFPSRWGDQLV